MLLLKEPYGLSLNVERAWISLRSVGDIDLVKLKEILKNYSCYKPAIPRILSCIKHSSRYDCLLAGGWFKTGRYSLAKELEEIGVELIVYQVFEEEPISMPIVESSQAEIIGCPV